MWAGCVGESGVDQLVEIIKVLGTPTREEIYSMNPNYTEFKFPKITAHPWSKVFSKRMPPDAVDLVQSQLLPLHVLWYAVSWADCLPLKLVTCHTTTAVACALLGNAVVRQYSKGCTLNGSDLAHRLMFAGLLHPA